MASKLFSKINKKNISSKKLSLSDILCILMGTFITMPIITINLSGRRISLFTILFAVFLVYIAVDTLESKRDLRPGYMTKLYGLWFYLAIISSVFGLIYFSYMPEWSGKVSGYIPKIIMYLSLLLMLSMAENKEDIIAAVLKGFLIGCILNISWAVIEGFVYYIFNFSINNVIFSDYAKTLPADRRYITIVTGHGIRTPGFNYDPAHLGGIIPIIVLYSAINKKYFLLVLSLLGIVFSQSTTALVCSLILLILNLNIFMPNIKRKTFIRTFAAIGIFIIAVIIAASVFTNLQVIQSIKTNLTGFFRRIFDVYLNNKKTGIRTLYHLYVPIGMLFNGIKIITGTGFGTASYPYMFSPDINNALEVGTISAYDPESTYISYLFDVGIIGLILYAIVLYKNYQHFSNKWRDKKRSLVLAALGGIIFSGFFYHYTLTAYQVVILILSSVLMDIDRKKEIKGD